MKQKTTTYNIIAYTINAFILLFVCSCSGLFNSADLREQALAEQKMQIEQRVYHYSADSSLLLFKVNTNELLYSRTSKENNFSARLLVEVKLIDPNQNKTIYLDSLVYQDNELSNEEDLLVGRIPIPFESDKKLEIRTRYTDLNKRQEVILQGTSIKNSNALSDAVLLIMPNGLPLISSVNQYVGTFTVTGNSNGNAKLYYCNNDFPLPAPPFAGKNDLGNVRFEIKPLGDSITLNSENTGFYKITSDNNNEAFTFLHRPNGYPKTSDFKELLEATAYFQTKDELDLYLNNSNPRLAFENFWLKLTGNKDKAKRSIQVYYDRLSDANKYFTQYTDGWKTDRGMLYIILGPPSRVFYQDNNEIWIYGRDNNVNNVSFNFEQKYSKEIGLFYELNRSNAYRQLWSIAVGTWRAGRVFNF